MKNLVRFATMTLFALAISFPTTAQQKAPTSNFLPKAQEGRHEEHPHIRGAIRELQEAKHELQTAAHDFGGHRAEALRSCDEAIHQLQLALQYDKR